MRKLSYRHVIVSLIIGLCFSSLSIAKEKLAVMDLHAKHGVEKTLAEGLSVVVRDTIHGFGNYEVLSKEDVEVIVERTAIRQSLGCDDTQCLINIGRSLGTKYMVAGAISRFGQTYNISLRLIDTMGKDPGVRKRVNRNCKCEEDELINSAITVSSLLMGRKEPVKSAISPLAPIRENTIKNGNFINDLDSWDFEDASRVHNCPRPHAKAFVKGGRGVIHAHSCTSRGYLHQHFRPIENPTYFSYEYELTGNCSGVRGRLYSGTKEVLSFGGNRDMSRGYNTSTNLWFLGKKIWSVDDKYKDALISPAKFAISFDYRKNEAELFVNGRPRTTFPIPNSITVDHISLMGDHNCYDGRNDAYAYFDNVTLVNETK